MRFLRLGHAVRHLNTKAHSDLSKFAFTPLVVDDAEEAFVNCNPDFSRLEPMARALGLRNEETAAYVRQVVNRAIQGGFSFKAIDLETGKPVGYAMCSINAEPLEPSSLHEHFQPIHKIYEEANMIFDQWNREKLGWKKWLFYDFVWIASEHRGNYPLSKHISFTGFDFERIKAAKVEGMAGVTSTRAVLRVAHRNGWKTIGTVDRTKYIQHRVPLPKNGFMATAVIMPIV